MIEHRMLTWASPSGLVWDDFHAIVFTLFYIFTEILKLILEGRLGQAIDITSKLYPGLLEGNSNLLFALKCRQFVEMVNGTDSESDPDDTAHCTSVIQSTKLHTVSSADYSSEGCNHNNSMNGSCNHQFHNGRLEDDIEMEDNTRIIYEKNHADQKNDTNSNGVGRLNNGDDVEMGMDMQLLQ